MIFTEKFGIGILADMGLDFWGRWPLTIHSAGWGMILNATTCAIVSSMTQNSEERAHRMKYHSCLREHASLPASKKGLVPVAWGITIAWMFFGIGPGAVIGNDIFGAPNAGIDGWTFGMPSIWVWQILFWLLVAGELLLGEVGRQDRGHLGGREVANDQAAGHDQGDAAERKHQAAPRSNWNSPI